MLTLLLFSALIFSCAPVEIGEQGRVAPPTDPLVEGATPEMDGAAVVIEPAPLLLERGLKSVEEAQKLRRERSMQPFMGGFAGHGHDSERYYALYDGAEDAFTAVIEHHPLSPEAPESQYMLGLIHDYPHLNDFNRAAREYRKTKEKYPGTPAALRAGERLEALLAASGGPDGDPHGLTVPKGERPGPP